MDYLAECGSEVKDNTILPVNEIVGYERSTVHIG